MENRVSIVKEACLLVCYLAMDVLLSCAWVAGMCLPRRCLAMGIHVIIQTNFILYFQVSSRHTKLYEIDS
jgi:hypothetical protein